MAKAWGQGGLTFSFQAEEYGKRIWKRSGSWWGLGQKKVGEGPAFTLVQGSPP